MIVVSCINFFAITDYSIRLITGEMYHEVFNKGMV
jgi:hypothetical protein